MRSRVFAVLVSRNASKVLPRTLEALAAGTKQPDTIIGVDTASNDDSANLMREHVDTVVKLRSKLSFGQAAAQGVAELPEAEEGDWLWLLAHDAAPEPDALAQLTSAAEANRHLAIIGPKIMRVGDSRTINEFGQTMTPFGNAVRLAAGELDQGQYDSRSDVLGVAETGLLIRRDVYEQLGGFDPALPTVDAGLDLGVRARLAGHQVALQPRARIQRNGGPELFSARSLSDASLTAIRRRAQLHRRFAYANAFALILHWLLALPLALLRGLGHVLAKRPAALISEFSAALAAMFGFRNIANARRRIRTTRTSGWAALASLRIDWRTLRARRRLVGDDVVENAADADDLVGFAQGGALWVFAFALLAGVIANVGIVTSSRITGGALLPLGSFTDMWSGALFGDRDLLGSLPGPADPFSIVVALLGSVTFWQPSQAIVLLLVLAPALSTVTVWLLVRRLTRVVWAPVVAAAVWAFSPTLFASIADGRIGAVLAHVMLPLVAYGLIRARDSWRGVATGSLALAIVLAGAPSLLPAAVAAVVVAAIWFLSRVRPGGAFRAVSMLVPAAALFAPLAWAHTETGNWLAGLADPGIPLGYDVPDALVVATGYPDAALATLSPLLSGMEIAGTAWPMWLTIGLAAPLALAAFAAPFLRALPGVAGVAVALAGFATAVAASRIAVAFEGETEVFVWTGPGLSLAMLGLVIAAMITIGVLAERSAAVNIIVTLCAAVTGVALVIGAAMTPSLVQPEPERSMPALVVAAADEQPHVGTLVIEPVGPDAIRLTVVRGHGEVLSDVQTVVTTAQQPSEATSELSQFTVDLVSGSSIDATETLMDAGIGFILLRDASDAAESLHQTISRGLDERAELQGVGATDAGLLWTSDAIGDYEPDTPAWAWWLLFAQLLVLLLALLLALPSMRRGARKRVRRAPEARKDFA
ncbi:MAG TPA: glycosyltransferase family 2 protein [Candidatus Agrococcus pullicola]|uniref:Glycosyltransferase family 2 protein n=1 Tax=Candidatus Agrococcus pullicola TaxID=2838429 RepID=A0A9D1YX43_9MICO|nr:glycosyltransferase family 2 protein [Candidatus Agrococcus pullicola]